MKKVKTSGERYALGNGYILEVWEEHSKSGRMWEFWAANEETVETAYMFGLPENQPGAKDGKTKYTKEEAIEIAAANVPNYI